MRYETAIERIDHRERDCIERWAECHDYGHSPRCCRFPKSCSAGIIERKRIKVPFRRQLTAYLDAHSWWVGYSWDVDFHYVCLLPTVVFRWRRYPGSQ